MSTNARVGGRGARGGEPRAAVESDRELVARMLKQDQRAWQTFAARYDGLVKLAINRVVSRFRDMQRADAEEIYAAFLSSLFVEDMLKLRSFDFARGRPLGAWLSVVASRAAWNHLRHAKRRSTLLHAIRGDDPRPELGVDPVHVMIVREDCRRLGAMREKLTARDRQFFDVMYVEQASADEVASAMGVSVKTVYTKHYKVRIRLAREMERADHAPLRAREQRRLA